GGVGPIAVAGGPSDGESLVARARAVQRRLWEAIDAAAAPAPSGAAVAFELLDAGSAARGTAPAGTALDGGPARGAAVDGRPDDGGPPRGAAPDGWRAGGDPPPRTALDCRPAERDGALTVSLDAVEGLFPEGVVEAMADALGDLLRRLADEPPAWTDPFPVRLPADQRERRAAVNATGGPLAERRLHEPFLDRAAEDPDRVAVVAKDAQLTYAELEARSRALAARLADRGARRDGPIGVAMEKGWEQVVAVLGILRAGAPYLPIDPALPEPRVRYLVEHGQVGTVLTQPHLVDRLPLPEGVQPVVVAQHDDDADAAAPDIDTTPSDVAYVIFTSGSTGVPKGVTIEHRAALNTVLDINRRFGVGADDRAIAISSLSFDLSVYDVFGLLAAGGAVVVPDPASARDPGAWAELCEAEGVTLWSSVPALVKLLADHLESRDRPLPEALRVVMMSGDWIPVTLPARLQAMGGDDLSVYGLGGATEASIWSNFHPTTGPEPGWDSIPYGRPLANQRFHVLDERLEPRPDWVPGELYIAGEGLARGYWRDPGKTHAAFVFHPRTGERLYRTGDFGRYRPSGDIEFLGRRDAQVKVHGHRIELGEIETALERHPAVRAAVATAAGDPRGDRRLVAYVVAESGRQASERELQDHVAAQLPEYMVPTAIATIAAIPLTANGKVDRDALPDVATLASGDDDDDRPPGDRPADALADMVRDGRLDLGVDGVPLRRDAVEALARRLSDALGEPPADPLTAAVELAASARVAALLDLDEPLVPTRVPLNRLGLDSLVAMSLHDELHAGFGVEVPLRSLMRGMTVSGLADAVVGGGGDGDGGAQDGERGAICEAPATAREPAADDEKARFAGSLRIEPDPEHRHEPFALNDIQQAYLVGRSGLFQLSEVSTHYYAEIDTEDLDVPRFERALNRVIARHDMLRAIVLPEGRQKILEDVPPIEVPVEDVRGPDAQERLERRREEMSHQVVQTDTWPLLDVRVSITGERTARVHFGIDLLVADAASWALFGRDLVRFYEDPDLELAPLELSFRDYVRALERLEGSAELRRALDYWLGRDLPGPPELPLAADPQTLERVHFVRRHDELTAEEWQRIKRRASEEELTPSGVLCAAFSEVLAAWADSPRFTLNVTTYHRPPVHPQMPELVGDFTSLTMLAVDAACAGSFRERALAAQRQLWEDLDHRQVNGVRVLRERARAGRSHGLMPIVFTSVLGIDQEEGLDRLGRQVYAISQTPQVWLDHQVLERGGRLAMSFDWVEGLFPEGMVEAMFEAYVALLRRLAAEPAWWDAPFPVELPPDQRERRARFNATAVDLPERRLHDGFLDRAAEHPDRLAVVAAGRRLTYGE
ncbi:MAG TPA: amino acid adenylation domain-containing protein, partial [Solirubrobacteraceae bacterium]|nr:amino acid adenylation domain-containing protein [Solirubrobacteraceae bacterium]